MRVGCSTSARPEHTDDSKEKTSVSELVETILRTQARINFEEKERERIEYQERVKKMEIHEFKRIPMGSLQGLPGLLVSDLVHVIQYAVKARYKESYKEYKTGILLRLADDFQPMDLAGNIDIAPGVVIGYWPDAFRLKFFDKVSSEVSYIKQDNRKYVELGATDVDCLATIAFIAFSLDDLEPLYNAIITYISRLMPFKMGAVDLVGYDDLVERCDRILSCNNPLIMNRHILLAGPPGCGKSMIAKRLARSHPEYVRCCLTHVKNWLQWVSLLAKVLGKCSRKVLLIVDEIDELGRARAGI